MCKTSDKLNGRSVCPESTRFCCLAPWRLCLLLHSESLEYAELSQIHLLPGLLPTVRVPERSGECVPRRLLIYATAVVLSKRKRTCLGTGSRCFSKAFRAKVAARNSKTLMCTFASSTLQWPPVDISWYTAPQLFWTRHSKWWHR